MRDGSWVIGRLKSVEAMTLMFDNYDETEVRLDGIASIGPWGPWSSKRRRKESTTDERSTKVEDERRIDNKAAILIALTITGWFMVAVTRQSRQLEFRIR
jgi:hypothetical protein